MHGWRWLLLLASPSVAAVLALPAGAQVRSDCPGGLAPQGIVVAVDGDVTARGQGGSPFNVSVGTSLCPFDEITTGSRSRIEFRLAGKDTTTGTSSNAVTVIPGPESDCVTLLGGILALISSVEGTHCVRTPFIDAGIEGTEAVVAVDGATGDSFVLVRAGEVGVVDRRAPADRLLLEAGPVEGRSAAFATQTRQLTVATPENVPAKFRALLLRPEGATDWAVYYPPILLGAGVADPTVQHGAALLDGGDPAGAERALSAAPLEGKARAAALALRAVAAVSLNDPVAGEALADESVALDPGLGAGHIARSYALQGLGGLDAARDAAQAAVDAAPGDAYAWARLAELELTIGNRRAAETAVVRSLAIAETALARTIEGFAALAANDFDAAETAFGRAIAIDSEAPLPRLGLGLAAVRQGRLAEGRLEMETAVALDPRRASLRTWLGRAYLEERRPEKAADQFELAQEGDPDDPNAYLFSALERFQANDPIGALRELETAQDVGDRRAVVRSESGLGEDRAVRSAAIGRVYDLLGFERLLQITGGIAVDEDRTSPEAHRLLADAARTDPDAEITQVSEYWKSTLLAPPSKTPIQPRLGAIDLGLLETPGAARVTFAEFAPLFDTEGVRADVSGFGGTQHSFGYEASATALVDNVSFGVGGFLFDTDGYSFNQDLKDEVYTVQTKFRPAPELTVTAEFGLQETKGGDRRLTLPPFLPRQESLRIRSENEQARLGFHYRPRDDLSLLAYAEAATLDWGFSNTDIFGDSTIFDGDQEGIKVEGSLLLDRDLVDLQIGGEFARIDVEDVVTIIPGAFPIEFDLPLFGDVELARAYGYVDVEFPANFYWTVGGAFERYEEERGFRPVSVNEWQPRLGLRVEPLPELVFRAAYTETLTRRSIFPETLDRTTVASFGQYLDEAPGVEFQALSGAIDLEPWPSVEAGVEVRDIDVVFPERGGFGGVVDVLEVGGYLSLTVHDAVSLSFEPEYTTVDAPSRLLEVDELDTLLLPLTAAYFHPSGAFASGTLNYFDQDGVAAGRRIADSGFVFDAVLGYRLPRGRGVLTVEALNLFDADVETVERVEASDFTNINETLLLTPRLAPDRTVLATLTLSF